MDDPRNLLLFEFARIVRELQPDYWVMENVQGLMMGRAKLALEEFLAKVKAGGYNVVNPIKVFDASEFGVPQRRKRVFVIGYKSYLPAPSYDELNVGGILSRSNPSVWDAISDLQVLDSHAELISEDTYTGTRDRGSTYSMVLAGETSDSSDLSGRRRRRSHELTGCRRSRHTRATVRRFARTKPGSYEPVSKFYRLDMTGLAHTLRAGTPRSHGGFTAPRPIHPIVPRCITVREAARLHSFPDWFVFDSTIWHGFRQVGNSVPPLFARAVGNAIRKATSQALVMGHSRMGD